MADVRGSGSSRVLNRVFGRARRKCRSEPGANRQSSHPHHRLGHDGQVDPWLRRQRGKAFDQFLWLTKRRVVLKT